MSSSRLAIVGLVLALLSGSRLQAQQPQKPDSMAAGMTAMSGNCLRSDPAADQRLSQLVDAMNAAPSNQRVAAMMATINELATRDRAMSAHMSSMHKMHEMHMPGMMHGADGARPMRRAPAREDPLKPR